jgi:hypothetical protein
MRRGFASEQSAAGSRCLERVADDCALYSIVSGLPSLGAELVNL